MSDETVPAADPKEDHETPGGNPVNEPETEQPEEGETSES